MKASDLRKTLELVNEIFPSPEGNRKPCFVLQGDKLVLVIWFVFCREVRFRPIEIDTLDVIDRRQLMGVKRQHEKLLARGE